MTLGLSAQTYEVLEVQLDAKIQPIDGINTKWAEFSPVLVGDDMYFTSSRQFNQNNLGEDNWEKIAYLNLFKARVKWYEGKRSIKDVNLLSNKLNFGTHTGPASFTANADTVFFTRVIRLNDGGEKVFRSQLYMSVKKKNKWTKIKKLPFCENSSSYAYPSFDQVSKRLYFSSNRAGGKGQYDIYFVKYKDGNWTEPTNVEAANTAGNETYPFVINENLFFSSDKPGGLGGLDIYFSAPAPANFPITIAGLNSSANDFGMSLLPDLSAGYFSSDRNGNDDIFYCTISRNVTMKNQLAGTFTFRTLNTSASDLTVQIFNDEGEFVYEQKTDESGYFIFDNIQIDSNYSVRLDGVAPDEMTLQFYDENGETIADFILNEEGSFKYKKMFYDDQGILQFLPDEMIDEPNGIAHFSGKLVIETDPQTPLINKKVQLINKNEEVLKTVFTDERGNFNFDSLDISESYFITIPDCQKDLLLYIYTEDGEIYSQLKCNTQDFFLYQRLSPSLVNKLALLKETDEGDFMLNRSEIIGRFISNADGSSPAETEVHVYNDDGDYMGSTMTDSLGYFYFNNLSAESSYKFTLDEKSEQTLSLFNRFGKEVATIQKEENNFFIFRPLGYISEGGLDVLQEENLSLDLNFAKNYDAVILYFGSDQAKPKNGDVKNLNELAEILKRYPELKLSINAYTDATASDEYNFALSKKRGKWIVNYLISQGVDASRLTVNAYGETQLIDPENDAVNRRAELRIYQ